MAKNRTSRAVAIRDYLTSSVYLGTPELVPKAAAHFKISRQAIHRHLATLVHEGALVASGNTRARVYAVRTLEQIEFPVTLAGLDEGDVWRERLHRFFEPLSGRVALIAHTCFTEILNNAIDHSEGTTAYIIANRTAVSVEMFIADDGVGIFQKIKDALALDDIRHSILELAKGKFTTAPERHSGMGILVASLACDRFSLTANGLDVLHVRRGGNDYLLTGGKKRGTTVGMTIMLNTPITMQSVYDQLNTPEHPGFTRTVIPLDIARMGEDNLVSRSQAKRVVAGIDRFMEVVFDFAGVDSIGQGFADEIFRVFRLNNPHVNITTMNTSSAVQRMISIASAAYNEAMSRGARTDTL
jgi:Signal transduction histidine kinase